MLKIRRMPASFHLLIDVFSIRKASQNSGQFMNVAFRLNSMGRTLSLLGIACQVLELQPD